jgi:pyruvate dehydrogenase E1 component
MNAAPPREASSVTTAVLEEIQRRVLWLATLMVHHANNVRKDSGGAKVGGHQASSASVVTLMTYLFFEFLRRGDRISVKPHAAPVLHAVHYLLGRLDAAYLTTLRQHHGLQAYPSRTKDPDPVDFSTGSMGLGSVAPNYAALVERFVHGRFGVGGRRRYVSLVGDGELDEGSIWETIAEPALAGLDNVIWVVDLNRQSLDRVVPGIRVRQLEAMFRDNGWQVIEAKYGRRLEEAFAMPGGDSLRRWIDDMSNEEYQFLLRAPASSVRAAFPGAFLDRWDDAGLPVLIADLGGHDLEVLRRAFRSAEAASGPAVIFAYTIKGWGLPIAGDPLNHQALLSGDQIAELRGRLGIAPGEDWAAFPPDSPAGRLCAERGRALAAAPSARRAPPEVPQDLGRTYTGASSTQQSFGLVLTVLARERPSVAERIVTVSPDVAISTNLGGWINRVGVWSAEESSDPFTTLGPRLITWRRTPRGQHIELGISEGNLLMALGQLGLAAELIGEPLLPIGTVYDPFVARALDAFAYGLYSGARFVLVGTPSGVTLASEGGAHQSVISPSIGVALPGVVYWEPCFAQELEWILLESLRALHRAEHPESAYLRLTTARVDQSLFPAGDRAELRARVLSGAYRLVDRSGEPGYSAGENAVEIWATGVVVPEALRASDDLRHDGIYASVVNCVSPDLVYRRWQSSARRGIGDGPGTLPARGRTPVVSVIDGHPSALSWVGSMLGVRAWPLGVTRYGESGTRADLYRDHGIDAASIRRAAQAALADRP